MSEPCDVCGQPTKEQADRMLCFKCGDGNTPLYCLNCANDQRIDALEQALGEREAECAVARQALETCSNHDHSNGDDSDCVCCAAIKAVMDTNCGASFLKRLEAAERQLGEAQSKDSVRTKEHNILVQENRELTAKLRAFEEAMEQCSKPEWSQYLNELAEWLEDLHASSPGDKERLKACAINLGYMATSFTLKANFVPSELRIKELEAKVVKLKEREQEHAKIIGMREGVSSVDKPGQPVSHSIQRRLKVLDACAQRWKECKEPICEAIYQGAAFELRLFADKLQAHQQALKEARVALEHCHLRVAVYSDPVSLAVEKALSTINSVLEQD